MEDCKKTLLSITLLSLFILIASSHAIAKRNNSKLTCMSASKNPIIINLVGVVMREKQSTFSQRIGYGECAHYTLTHWKHPGTTCLKMLDDISKKMDAQRPHVSVKLQECLMPQCIIDFNRGIKSCDSVKEELLSCIDFLDNMSYFASKNEKKLMSDIITLLFNPQETAYLIEPVQKMIGIIKKLKNAGHQMYLFANGPHELRSTMYKQYGDIMTLFDGATFSCDINMIKPEEKMFSYFIDKHHLNPHKCIMIDDQKETCTVAQKFGMQTITYDRPSNVIRTLKKLGVTLN